MGSAAGTPPAETTPRRLAVGSAHASSRGVAAAGGDNRINGVAIFWAEAGASGSTVAPGSLTNAGRAGDGWAVPTVNGANGALLGRHGSGVSSTVVRPRIVRSPKPGSSNCAARAVRFRFVFAFFFSDCSSAVQTVARASSACCGRIGGRTRTECNC